MKVLFVAAEAVPFVKIGGLADVAFSLPKKLREMNVDARVVIPNHGQIPKELVEKAKLVGTHEVNVGWRRQYSGVLELEHEGVPFYLIDNEYYFKRDGVYGHDDDGERYAFFSKAALEMIGHIDFEPDVVHFNDWHTSMVGMLHKTHYSHLPEYSNIKTVFTIHNLKYQGVFGYEVMDDILNLHTEHFHGSDLEFFGSVNFMKAGIVHSDAITTVSRSYASEIQYPYYGENLDGILRSQRDKLYGIVNGIDYDMYNPKNNPHIAKNYDLRSINRKSENKMALQKELGLPVNKDIPMIGMVTRLADMKGLDLLESMFMELLQEDVQFVVLGTGEHRYESMMQHFKYHYPEKLSANITFDSKLAHKIYASSDMFLMPSRFEPCGLGQLIALRYGSVPIVRETGGLRDTITPYNKFTGEGNGFSFANYNAHEMYFTVKSALEVYDDKKAWRKLVRSAMKSDNSWNTSAEEYKALYTDLIKE